jgi:uncharacterized metal-binding protein
MNCISCEDKECYQGKDCFGLAKKIKKMKFSSETLKMIKVASKIEAEHYMKSPRLKELIDFCQRMDYKKLGLAFCIGLSEEASLLGQILQRNFKVYPACCKIGGIDKRYYHLPKISSQRYEAMCNPVGQALFLNKLKVDLNIICGLCIGHDILFTKESRAPVTTFIVKDRVLAHNPAGALYSKYHRDKFIQKNLCSLQDITLQ